MRIAARSALVALVGCAGLLVAARGLAQGMAWEGPASLGLEVKSSEGKAVPGAQVRLRYSDAQPTVSLPALTTDAKGQVVVGHLAEGSWYVEVSHPDAMLFTAYLELKVGKAAKSTFAAQVSTGSSWSPLRVEFFKVKGAAPPPQTVAAAGVAPVAPVVPSTSPAQAPAVAPAVPPSPSTTAPVAPAVPSPATAPTVATTPVAPAPAPAATPAAAPAPPARPAPATAAPVAAAPAPAVAPPAPSAPAPPPASAAPPAPPAPAPTAAPRPAPAATPAQAPPRPTTPPPAPAATPAAPAPTAPAASAPPSPPAAPPRPAPTPAPQPPAPPATPPTPAARPAPPAPAPAPAPAARPAPPAPVPAPATAPAPAAPPAATAAPAPAAPSPVAGLRSAAQGNCPECGSGEWAATGEQAAAALATGVDCGAIAAAARPGLTALAHSAPQPAERGYAGPVVAPVPAGSPCSVVAIVLPGDARYVGYRYEAVDGWGGGDCVAEKPCAIGSGHWLGHPTIERGQRIVVWAVYVNQSAERSRRARLTAYFRPGATFAQPSQ